MPSHHACCYKSYLDDEYYTILEKLKSVYRHCRKISRKIINPGSGQDLTFLIYHSVQEEPNSGLVYPPCTISAKKFETQIKYATKHYNVISIGKYLECVEKNTPLPRKSMIISFDDGYLDNLRVAIPILEKYNLPAIIYLATRYIDHAEAQWVDRMYNIFNYRNKQAVELDFLPKHDWNMAIPDEQRSLFSILNELLIIKTYDERETILEELSNAFRYEGNLPRLTLNWEDVKEISEKYPNISLGSHTDQHLDVRTHRDELENEVLVSCKKLKKVTNKNPRHFSFPYERVFDGSHEKLSELGIRSAVCEPTEFEVKPEFKNFYITRVDTTKYSTRQWWYIKH